MRPSGREHDQLRDIAITRDFTCHAEGSVLVAFGRTKVICTASIEDSVPSFLKGSGRGWVRYCRSARRPPPRPRRSSVAATR